MAENESGETNPPDASIPTPSGIKFRPRKRAKKARKRNDSTAAAAGEHAADDQLDDGMTRSELILVKEAQKLREENRKTALDVTRRTDDKAPDQPGKSSENLIAGGLQGNFALEKTGNLVEERMDRYIEERMKLKFGDKDADSKHQAQQVYDDERELFVIPERLRVVERPMYDPGEGLPAGVEEVELSDEARRRNQEQTLEAHRELMASKVQKDEEEKAECLPGNLSSNFAQHRNDWIDVHLGSRNQRASGRSDGMNYARNGQSVEKGEREAGGRSSHLASDFALAERFKKRWKR